MKPVIINAIVFVILIFILGTMIVFFNGIGNHGLNDSISNTEQFSEFHLWTVTIGSLATAAALGFVGYETLKSRSERKNMLRAWIGAEKGLTESADKIFEFYYHNYGQLPAKDTRMKVWSSNKELVQEKLDTKDASIWPHNGTIMPTQTKAYGFGATSGDFEKVKSGENDIWIGIVISYHFAGSTTKGEYGVIYKFTPKIKDFSVRDEWVK